MTNDIRWVALTIFLAFFALVTVMGFMASRWLAGDMKNIDEWGLGGRRFGAWITWFLVGGDFYTAYTVIAVPALVYSVGAYGFFALPYTILVYPFIFVVMPKLWKAAQERNCVTAADYAHSRFGSRALELAVAVTGIVATMPYIALQLIGMEVVLKAMGLTGEIPLVIAFLILALYTYSSGLRAPALIAFVKDIMIYIVVIAAVVAIPLHLGGYGAVFAAAGEAFRAKGGATGVLLPEGQLLPFATLALGSAFAAFMYPHTMTGVLASRSADVVRVNAIYLPAYTLLLGGVWILQILPTIVLGLFSRWVRPAPLFVGWAFGITAGTYLAFADGLKPVHSFSLGGESYTVYTGLTALAINLVITIAGSLAARRFSEAPTVTTLEP